MLKEIDFIKHDNPEPHEVLQDIDEYEGKDRNYIIEIKSYTLTYAYDGIYKVHAKYNKKRVKEKINIGTLHISGELYDALAKDKDENNDSDLRRTIIRDLEDYYNV